MATRIRVAADDTLRHMGKDRYRELVAEAGAYMTYYPRRVLDLSTTNNPQVVLAHLRLQGLRVEVNYGNA